MNYSDWYGPPVLFTDPGIERMLRLANVSKNDVLYDLGCGHAQNLIVAATKFAVRNCVGVEQVRNRYEKAREQVARQRLSRRIRIVQGDMDDLLKGKFRGIEPSEATVVLYTIQTTKRIVKLLSESLRTGCRLLYNAENGVFPEIKPVALDYPFYMSTVPFEAPVSERDWLRAVLLDEQVRLLLPVPKLWKILGEKLGLDNRETRSYQKRLAQATLQ